MTTKWSWLHKGLVALVLVAALPNLTRAADGGTPTSSGGSTLSGATCPDSKFFSGKMFTDLCWKCFFPVVVMGFPIGPGPLPDDTAFPICVCPGKMFGIASYGTVIGLWEPSHLFEVVRQPWCSPVLGQPLIDSDVSDATTNTGFGGLSRWGGYDPDPNPDGSLDVGGTFYNWHWWIYPANILVNELIGTVCQGKSGADMDLAYISEIDPTWINDEQAFYTQPEAKLFSNPIAVAACAIDSVASTVHKPIAYMYWCAGTWGHAYPFTGNINNQDSPNRNAGLVTFRALAALHRRTLAKRTYGTDSTCANTIAPMIQKQQYRLQSFYPMPEKSSNHWLGASPFKWGEWRNIPWKGEDFIIMQWRYTECCATFW